MKYGDSLLKQLFGMWAWVSPRKHVLDGDAHWRHMANMIEPSMCCGGLVVQPFMSNYFDHLFCYLCEMLRADCDSDGAVEPRFSTR